MSFLLKTKNEDNQGNANEVGEEKRIATTVPSTATANLGETSLLRKYKNGSDQQIWVGNVS
jgi:hypothetical protein